MEPMDDDYTSEFDTRNVKGTARLRGKKMAMVTKSYSCKAVQKIMYSKQERDKKRMDAYMAVEKERQRAAAEKEWADPVSDKRAKKMKEKEIKAEEKAKKKMEKKEIYLSEVSNGHKHSKKL